MKRRQIISGLDQNGNTVFTGRVTGHGVRVHAEAPGHNSQGQR